VGVGGGKNVESIGMGGAKVADTLARCMSSLVVVAAIDAFPAVALVMLGHILYLPPRSRKLCAALRAPPLSRHSLASRRPASRAAGASRLVGAAAEIKIRETRT
jgi:hypothetical protein